MKINVFWFRRDLRLEDNAALNEALSSDLPVMPVFIFDTNITDDLPGDDARISFIYNNLASINDILKRSGSSINVLKGKPDDILKRLSESFDLDTVYVNRDYEPYATRRDSLIRNLLAKKDIKFLTYKDQVIFEEKEILKPDNTPYTVFTAYKNRWMKLLGKEVTGSLKPADHKRNNFLKSDFHFPSLDDLGFSESPVRVKPYDLSVIPDYNKFRDIPAADRTSYLSPYLRFGTISIRKLVRAALEQNQTFLNELIWREFFMQILYNFPGVVSNNFKSQYDDIVWRNDEKEFLRWCRGETGYPIVDAGMHQLNQTGYMHNRVRMITAGFLCKHLLVDWRWGEAYFAEKLLDYELSSNNGNWQWAAGTGCDAAPYFRIFNPITQQQKFDREFQYVKTWAGDYGKPGYPQQIVGHDYARQRALNTYKEGMKRKGIALKG